MYGSLINPFSKETDPLLLQTETSPSNIMENFKQPDLSSDEEGTRELESCDMNKSDLQDSQSGIHLPAAERFVLLTSLLAFSGKIRFLHRNSSGMS